MRIKGSGIEVLYRLDRAKCLDVTMFEPEGFIAKRKQGSWLMRGKNKDLDLIEKVVDPLFCFIGKVLVSSFNGLVEQEDVGRIRC